MALNIRKCEGKEILLQIEVRLRETFEVNSEKAVIRMICFEGECRGDYFNGTVLPGAVDTQKIKGDQTLLSARYCMKGTDNKGNPCMVFVENQAAAFAGEELLTTPVVYTDSPSLEWMEEAELVGQIESDGVALVITILKKQEEENEKRIDAHQ